MTASLVTATAPDCDAMEEPIPFQVLKPMQFYIYGNVGLISSLLAGREPNPYICRDGCFCDDFSVDFNLSYYPPPTLPALPLFSFLRDSWPAKEPLAVSSTTSKCPLHLKLVWHSTTRMFKHCLQSPYSLIRTHCIVDNQNGCNAHRCDYQRRPSWRLPSTSLLLLHEQVDLILFSFPIV